MMDLDIDEKFTIELLAKIKILKQRLDSKEMMNIYRLISEKYVTVGRQELNGFYGFNPKFRFTQSLVDTYFISIAENSIIVNPFELVKALEDEGAVKNDEIYAVIQKTNNTQKCKCKKCCKKDKGIKTKLKNFFRMMD